MAENLISQKSLKSKPICHFIRQFQQFPASKKLDMMGEINKFSKEKTNNKKKEILENENKSKGKWVKMRPSR